MRIYENKAFSRNNEPVDSKGKLTTRNHTQSMHDIAKMPDLKSRQRMSKYYLWTKIDNNLSVCFTSKSQLEKDTKLQHELIDHPIFKNLPKHRFKPGKINFDLKNIRHLEFKRLAESSSKNKSLFSQNSSYRSVNGKTNRSQKHAVLVRDEQGNF